MSVEDAMQAILAALPGGTDLQEGITHWLALPPSQKIVETAKAFFQVIGDWEFLNHI